MSGQLKKPEYNTGSFKYKCCRVAGWLLGFLAAKELVGLML